MTRPSDPPRLNSLLGQAEVAPRIDALRRQLQAESSDLRKAGPTEAQKRRMWSALVAAIPELSAGEQGPPSNPSDVAQQAVWTHAGTSTPWAHAWWFGLLSLMTALPPSSYHAGSASVPSDPSVSLVVAPAEPETRGDSARSGNTLLKALADREPKPAPPGVNHSLEPPASRPTAVESESPTVPQTKVKTRHGRRGPQPRRTLTPDHGAEELRLLQRARAQAQARPGQALRWVAEHEQRHPRGQFVQEREVIAIHALVALGRLSQAEERARRFARKFPGSAHQRRIRWLLQSGAQRASGLEE